LVMAGGPRGRSYLLARAREIDSRLVLALDMHPGGPAGSERGSALEWARGLLSSLTDYVVAVKIGLPTLMFLGVEGVSRLVRSCPDYFYIADMKIADIGYIARLLGRIACDAGFDAVIAHAIVGREDGLCELVDEMHGRGGCVFSVVAMSHRGAEEVLNRNFEDLLRVSVESGVDGFILPATMPRYIAMARERVGRSAIILSPGVVKQGAAVGSAVRAGADFEIIGRGIYASGDPVSSAKRYASVLRWSA